MPDEPVSPDSPESPERPERPLDALVPEEDEAAASEEPERVAELAVLSVVFVAAAEEEEGEGEEERPPVSEPRLDSPLRPERPWRPDVKLPRDERLDLQPREERDEPVEEPPPRRLVRLLRS